MYNRSYYFFFIFLLLLVLGVNGQESSRFNEQFLDSLPEDIQAGLISNDDGPEEYYKNPKTRISKLETELKEASKRLDKIRYDLDVEIDQNDDDPRQRFGSRFFNTFQSTFLPVNNANLGANYIIDAGDVLTVQYIGSRSFSKELTVQRDGNIYLPEVGMVNVRGMALTDAVTFLEEQAKNAITGLRIFVSLTSVKDINVLIMGNAENPGLYTLPGGSSPLALIYAAGGIDDKGTYRNILHKRGDQIIQTIDLYDLFINGFLNIEYDLRGGDVLIVKPKLSEVTLAGEVANQAIYEFFEHESLDTIMGFGGLVSQFTSKTLQVSRYDSGKFLSLEIPSSDLSNFKLQDGDLISVYGADPKFNGPLQVTVTGEVAVPGIYTVDSSTSMQDLINKAGGYTDAAYPMGGILTRESAIKAEEEMKAKSFSELIRFLTASPRFTESQSPEGIISFLQLLQDYKPSGRVITNFQNPQKIFTRLEDKDKIHIPAFTNSVMVFGEVLQSGSLPYDAEKSIYDYIEDVGGISRVGDKSSIIIILPNGRAQLVSNGSFFSLLGNNTQLLPGSIIYVPREIGKLDGISFAGVLAPIVSSIALSLASLNSIN